MVLAIFNGIISMRIIFITALTNLFLVALIMFSCRWVAIARPTKKWMGNRFFKRLYKLHTYLWWFLAASLIIHATFALAALGFPFK